MSLVDQGLNRITSSIIGAAIDVHRALGPGLLESSYQGCLAYELSTRGVTYTREQAIPIVYKAHKVPCGYRADLIVEGCIIVEVKAVDKLVPLHRAQLMTYLRLTGIGTGLIINFNVPVLTTGIRRILLQPSVPPW
jgi:GxxExxY protein